MTNHDFDEIVAYPEYIYNVLLYIILTLLIVDKSKSNKLTKIILQDCRTTTTSSYQSRTKTD